MDPISIIVTALVAGAAAALKPMTEQAIKDAYVGMKGLIQRKYGGVGVAVLETDPTSKAQQAVAKEDLEKAGAGQDEELLREAKALLDAIQAHALDAPKAMGLDLEEIKEASLGAERILSHTTGVKAKGLDIKGEIRFSDVTARGGEETWQKSGFSPNKFQRISDVTARGREDSPLLLAARLHKRDHDRERVVSTGFAYETQADVPVDGAMPLACGQRYYFWVEIGEPVSGSIEEVPTSLPEGLPPEARLTVALFVFPDHIQTEAGEDVGELQLRADGSVIVTRQPSNSIVNLLSGKSLLERRLLFPVHTPNKPGTFHLRCNIYYEQILIQSRLISAHVMRRPQLGDRALRSIVDYTLSHKLDPAHLVRLEPHRLSLWRDPRPLVFINGCHTTALEPEMTLEFVSAFVENAGASGVIGTEITIFEPLARIFAEECLRRFMASLSIGEAVRGARLKLLKEGNPLGLVYIPYIMASLCLKQQGLETSKP